MADRDHSEAPEEVERRLQSLARNTADALPADLGRRLAAMRRQAVAELGTEGSGWSGLIGWPVRAMAVGATGLGVMVAAWVYLDSTPDPMALPLIGDSEVAIVDDMELLEELEFLAWLEEESRGAG